MIIKKWIGIDKIYKIYKMKIGGVGMIIQLSERRNNTNPSINLSLSDMIFNKVKRKAIFNYYDKNYTSTKEEDEIFNEMRGNYREEEY